KKKIPEPAKKAQPAPELEKIKQELKQKIQENPPQKKELEIKIESTQETEETAESKGYHTSTEEQKQSTEEDVEELSEEQKQIQIAEKTQIDSYGDVKIFKIAGHKLLHYVVPVERPTSTEKTIINTIKEAATRLITISPYKVRDPEQKRSIYYQKVIEILESSPQLNIQKRRFSFYADAVVREMVGYGIIDQLVKDDDLEEIMVIGPRMPVYIFHRKYEMMTTNIEFFSDQEIVDLINRIARQVGRRVDIASPLLDARLPDGSRVNATIPPASVMGSTMTIRKFKKDPLTIIDLLRANTLDYELAAFLWICVEGLGVKPANILISGGTGSGKTTLLNALGTFIEPQERIISIEDTAELNLPLKHWIRFEGRPPGLEGTGELTIDIMTKNSLRMRPDRVMVGEIRHSEAFSLFTAMNTGHDGMANPDSLIQMADGSIRELGNFCEEFFSKSTTAKINGMETIEVKENSEIIAINKENLQQEKAKIKAIWKRDCNKSFKIKVASGKEIKLSYDHPVFRLKNGFLEQIQTQECKIGNYICTTNSIEVNGTEFDPELAYFLGLLLGDGHLGTNQATFENKNMELQTLFGELAKKKFGYSPKIYKRSDGRKTSHINSTKIAKEIHERFSVPFGNKTKIFDIPKQIENAENTAVAAFLRGMFDTDGHVSDVRKSVVLATSNPKMAKKIPLLLKRFEIEGRLNSQKKDGKNHIGPYYRIFITGENNIKKFKESIDFAHPKKTMTLSKIIGSKENTNVDLIPNTGQLVKQIRETLCITQKELAKKAQFGNTRSVINAYETGARHPSRNALKKINEKFTEEFNSKTQELDNIDIKQIVQKILSKEARESIEISFKFAKQFSTIEELENKSGLKKKILYYYLKKNATIEQAKKEALAKAIIDLYNNKLEEMGKARQLITHINSITSNNIRWEKITEIKEHEENSKYYDLTLDKYHTFVANGIIVSNCMGTVHANSAKETIIRVTSPPMNVPEVMLSGLDLIIVEQRLHDKQKGTIRRITDISEVSGVLEHKTVTKMIYEYDHVEDKVKRTKNEISFIKLLQRFTGWPNEKMSMELDKRKKFLKKLNDQNIHKMQEVHDACQDFTLKEEEEVKNATARRTAQKN
ncbi:MAG: ATPase, T2SS/T4P/T4SS family, partial [Candidatus Moranbacteria bacterium]|nr:ATPase, T2SS/T4P/T4SS family [Candidatus Moranbacteria bacterium]